MRRKMALLCLMEMTFRRPATDRRLSFDDIAEATRLAVCDVENLVMHALAVGLTVSYTHLTLPTNREV